MAVCLVLKTTKLAALPNDDRLKASDELWLEEWLPQRVLPASHSEISFLQYTSGSTGE